MTTTTPGWYLRRLSRMSPSEVAHRVADSGRRRAWARRRILPDAVPTAPADLRPGRGFTPVLPGSARQGVPAEAAGALLAAADRVLAGQWTVLGVTRTDSADPDWFADPVSGRRAPDRELAFRINHRDETVTGNVKQVWEMSRHHHLTVLAAAYWISGDERYATVTADQLRSWWRANPFLTGVHWTSGIEAGIRLLSWVWIRRLLADWPKVGDLFEHDPDALRQIAWHQEFLTGFRSRGSSANNHVIAEAAGQLAAACAFDWYHRAPHWRDEAALLLEHELAANTFVSGLNRELATDYHRFVFELVLLGALEAQLAGNPLSDGTWQRLCRMLDAGVAVLDTAGNPPRQGDGDEGRALVVDDPHRDPWAVALGSGGAVFGPAPWWPIFPGSVQAALLGALTAAASSGPASSGPASSGPASSGPASSGPASSGSAEATMVTGRDRPDDRPRRFGDAGLVLLRSRSADGPEIWTRCDAGPHGFLSIAAHAHADALSLEVRHDGVEILADPGTYCYHGEPEWRQYFRSTLAHNTLQVGGVDQAASGGPFLWSSQPVTTVLDCQVGDRPVQTLTAEHDGYRRLDVPAVHRREVTLDSAARTLTVLDTLVLDQPRGAAGKDARVPVQLGWHLGPDVDAELDVEPESGDGRPATDGVRVRLSWTVAGERRHGELVLPTGLTWSVHRGETDPVLGWYSPGFTRRVPSVSIVGIGTGTTGSRWATRLTLP